MAKLKKAWSDPVWSKVIAGIILAAGAAAGTYVLHWWPAIGHSTFRAVTFLGAKTPMWNWLIGVGTILVLTVFFVFMVAYRSAKQEPENPLLSYTIDEFFGVEWRWHYGPRWSIENLHTLCLNCGLQVYMADASAFDVCPKVVFHWLRAQNRYSGRQSRHGRESRHPNDPTQPQA